MHINVSDILIKYDYMTLPILFPLRSGQPIQIKTVPYIQLKYISFLSTDIKQREKLTLLE